ncbi:hypothetical protein Tco_1176265 [Tanacetum coccineum]
MFIEQSHDEVYGCLKGGSGNSGGKRLAISMVEEAWLSEKKEVIPKEHPNDLGAVESRNCQSPNPGLDASIWVDLDMGSPGVEVPVFEGPPSPDYVPGPDGAEQHLLHRILHTFCSELSTRSSIRTEEMMMLMISFAVPAAVAYSADQGPIHCLSRRGLGCPFEPRRRHLSSPRKLLECVALPYLPHRLSFHYFITTSQIPSLTITYTTTITHVALLLMLRGLLVIPGAGIKSERLLTSYETEDPEMWLPLRKRRVFRTTPGSPPPPLDDEVGESSAAGAARQFGPTTAEADLYGFTDMLEAAPGRQMFLVSRPEEIDSDFRAAESRLSEAEAVSRDPKDSEEPQGSDDQATETAGTC